MASDFYNYRSSRARALNDRPFQGGIASHNSSTRHVQSEQSTHAGWLPHRDRGHARLRQGVSRTSPRPLAETSRMAYQSSLGTTYYRLATDTRPWRDCSGNFSYSRGLGRNRRALPLYGSFGWDFLSRGARSRRLGGRDRSPGSFGSDLSIGERSLGGLSAASQHRADERTRRRHCLEIEILD